MPRGKNTNVELICQECKGRFYVTRINKKTLPDGKLKIRRFCKNCKKVNDHVSGSEIKHSSGK